LLWNAKFHTINKTAQFATFYGAKTLSIPDHWRQKQLTEVIMNTVAAYQFVT